jgi:F-type H+-transporting ATPase subunit alpha
MADDRTLAYAEALFNVARAEGTLTEVEDELFRFSQTLQGSDELREALTDPAIPWPGASRSWRTCWAARRHRPPSRWCRWWWVRAAATTCPASSASSWSMSAAEANKAVAEVRTAVPLNQDQRDRLAKALGQATGRDVALKVVIDPSVMGGVIAEVGDTVIDGTVRTRSSGSARRCRPPKERGRGQPMAELTINTADIAEALRKNLADFKPDVETAQVGRVTEVGDGIANVSGLPGAAVNELLEFESGAMGLALNLDEESIGTVILGEAAEVSEGQMVKARARSSPVPVGDGVLGRVVDALGNPVDDKGPLVGVQERRLEIQAPGIMGRQPVHEPLQTGIKAIDAMTPDRPGPARADHRRPQDRQDHGRHRHDHQPARPGREVHLRRHRPEGVDRWPTRSPPSSSTAPWSTRSSWWPGASDPRPFKYLAPYAGCAMGQHWMENGEHGLVVYDDLSKQAEAYRQISLLLRRPPGREAYPGDVFYLHSRLLERAAKLSDENGRGSLTALPVIETKAGDISAYIPTNVISITDGQIFLETTCSSRASGPHTCGQSVSRVGLRPRIKALKLPSARFKGDLAQFLELEAFARSAPSSTPCRRPRRPGLPVLPSC